LFCKCSGVRPIAPLRALVILTRMAKKPPTPAAELARLRWAKTTPEERSAAGRHAASFPRPGRRKAGKSSGKNASEKK
jgi:hypothetical protein